jgi:hypothetical protein
MLSRVPVLVFAALANIALVTVAEAQFQSFPALPPPPKSCAAGKATVTAATAFPATLSPCPDSSLGTSCLAWTYNYNPGRNNTISSAAILVDTDVVTVPDGLHEGNFTGIGSGVRDVALVSFNTATLSPYTILTGTNVSAGTVTAIAQVGSTVGSCAIAGPDNVVGTGVGLAPVTTNETDQFGPCTIDLKLDSKGCPSDISVSGTGCTATKGVTPTITDNMTHSGLFLGGVCGNRFTSEGTKCTWYCPTSSGSCFQVCYP